MNIWFLACGLIFVAAACAAPQTQQNPNMEATIEASLFNSAVLKAQAQMEATIEASILHSVAHKAQIELDKSIPKPTATSTLVPTSTSLPSPTSVPTAATPTQTPTPTPNPETIYLTGSGNHGLIEVDLTAGWRTAELTHTGTGYFLVAVLTGSAGTLATLADDVDYSQGTADFYTEEVGRYLIYVVATGDWSITISAPTAPTPTPTQAPTATPTPAPTQAPTATPTPLSRDSEYNNKKYGYGLILPAGWNYQETEQGDIVDILPLVQAPETTIKTNPIIDSSLQIWAEPIPKGYFHIYELAENFSPGQADFMENHSVISKSWMRSFLEGDKKGLFPGYEVLSSHEKTDSGKTLKYIRNTRWYLLGETWLEVQIIAEKKGETFSFPQELEEIRDSITLSGHAVDKYASELGQAAVLATPISLATPQPVKIVSNDKAKEILDEIFWNSLPVIRMEKQYDEESDSWLETDNMVIDYRSDVANLFQTTFYQLIGETSPNNVSLALYSHSKYSELSDGKLLGQKLSEYPAWCCRALYNDLEMVVDAEYPFSAVLAHAGHEMGHARHRLKHENYHDVSSTLKEGIAEIFEAAMIRTIGDYAGVNSINLGFTYPATLNFNNVWDDIYQDLDDIEKPHNRGRALAWLALLNDSNLHMLKQEVEEAGFLSAQSLLFLADYFAAMSTSESDSYIDLHLTKSNMNNAKNFIRERVTRRNSTAPTQGLIEENINLWFLP